MLAETPVRTRGSDEIPESTEHPSWSIAGFALEISFWIARDCRKGRNRSQLTGTTSFKQIEIGKATLGDQHPPSRLPTTL
jgi:hypothetical protein